MSRVRTVLLSLAVLTGSLWLGVETAEAGRWWRQADSVIGVAESGMFRRLDDGRWQLSSSPGGLPVAVLPAKSGHYQIYREGSISRIYFSRSGLDRQLLLEGENIEHRSLGSILLARDSSGVFVFEDDHKTLEAMSLTWRLADFFIYRDQLHRISWESDIGVIYRRAPTYQILTGLSCRSGELLLSHTPFLNCEEGLYRLEDDRLIRVSDRLFSPAVNQDQLVGLTADRRGLRVFRPDESFFLDLGSEISSILLGAQRVFLQHPDRLVEIDPRLALSYQLPRRDLRLVLRPDGAVYLVSVSETYLSLVPGHYQSLGLLIIDEIRPFLSGWLAWRSRPGVTYFSTDGRDFRLLSDTWANTAPIEEALVEPSLALIWVTNAANRSNAYFLNNQSSWRRVTLPTRPTFTGPIRDLRALPANARVEFSGFLVVGPGFLDDEVVYLQDETGGIQIFLSASRGALPPSDRELYRVRGEVSSSAVRRVILDRASDIQKSSVELRSFELPTHNPNDLETAVGQIGSIILAVDPARLARDHFFTLGTGAKVHYSEARDRLTSVETITLTALVDYNSAARRVEIWALDTGEIISKRPIPPTPIVNPQTPAQTAQEATEAIAARAPVVARDLPMTTTNEEMLALEQLAAVRSVRSEASPLANTNAPIERSPLDIAYILGAVLAGFLLGLRKRDSVV